MTSEGGRRTEKDYLGEREIPADAYYGIETARAIENFPVSGLKEDFALIAAYLTLKKAAALTNVEMGVLDDERGRAILQAADEALPREAMERKMPVADLAIEKGIPTPAQAFALFNFGHGVSGRGVG